ncbi:MAG TPA: hypothetical protein VNS50_12095, partial [Ginsengibacter sp.]|nr:hypothetical protein [Ginsengibacter sp.]
NLARKYTIPPDVPFLLSLSDKTLPLLQNNKEILEKDSPTDEYYYDGSFHNALDFFEYRKKNFLDQQKSYTWLSWNVADASIKNELIRNQNISSLK